MKRRPVIRFSVIAAIALGLAWLNAFAIAYWMRRSEEAPLDTSAITAVRYGTLSGGTRTFECSAEKEVGLLSSRLLVIGLVRDEGSSSPYALSDDSLEPLELPAWVGDPFPALRPDQRRLLVSANAHGWPFLAVRSRLNVLFDERGPQIDGAFDLGGTDRTELVAYDPHWPGLLGNAAFLAAAMLVLFAPDGPRD